ncbi:MAG TPA: hypothetical protein VHE59_14230 [Mucilaginibacter sp.]|nr:hypothetical protein [Mucilaginibacter sp.]
MMKIKSILILIMSGFLFACEHGEKEIIVVPRNYVGYVIVIYNQKQGEGKSYLDGKRVYKIPQNGILKTQFPGDYGDLGLPKFYYDDIRASNQIPYFIDTKTMSSKIVGASGGETGVAEPNNGSEIEFQLFYVGTQKDMEKAYSDVQKLDILKLAK